MIFKKHGYRLLDHAVDIDHILDVNDFYYVTIAKIISSVSFSKVSTP